MRIVLHIGTHKTATSSIQATLRSGRVAIQEFGVAYPSPKIIKLPNRAAQHFIATLIASGNEEDLKNARRFIERAVATHPTCHTLVLSTESFYRREVPAGVDCPETADEWERYQAFVRRTARVFNDYPTEVWVTLRRLDNFALSLYQERIRSNEYHESISKFCEPENVFLRYKKKLNVWATNFSDLKVFEFERDVAGEGGAVGAYLQRLGLPLSYVVNDTNQLNEALHPHLIEFKRQLNVSGGVKNNSRQFAKSLMKFQKASDDPMLKESYSFLSLAEREQLCEKFKKLDGDIKLPAVDDLNANPYCQIGKGRNDNLPKYPGLPENYKARIMAYLDGLDNSSLEPASSAHQRPASSWFNTAGATAVAGLRRFGQAVGLGKRLKS